MRYALVSDIHGNLTALQAVFAHLKDRGPIDQVWCMGDIVGYGPDPNECIDFLREFDLRCVVGNHDLASVGMLDLAEFNPEAKSACEWTMSQLRSDNREFLISLPQKVSEGDYTLVHGSPRSPVWEYILSPSQAKAGLRYLSTRHCLVGHTHIPGLFLYPSDDDACIAARLPVEQDLDVAGFRGRLLINPGSVGQPRDGDPRASYALLDSETSTMIHFRVPYDIQATQERMLDHGLPETLVDRLAFGW